MFTLMLAAALVLPQDDSAPEISTSSAVIEFLDAAQDHLYDPRDDGLESLAFEVPLGIPMPGGNAEVGVSTVSWTVGEAPEVMGRVANPLPVALTSQMPEAMQGQVATQIEASLVPLGVQVLSFNLGDYFGQLLKTHSATLGTTDGNVSVTFDPKDPTATTDPRTTWMFDEDGVPLSSMVKVEQPGQFGPVTITVTAKHNYRAGPRGKLLLESVTSTSEFGGQSQVNTTHLSFTEHGGMLLLSAIENVQKMGDQEIRNLISMRGITANGEAVTVVREEPVPVTTPERTEPAAHGPDDGHGH